MYRLIRYLPDRGAAKPHRPPIGHGSCEGCLYLAIVHKVRCLAVLDPYYTRYLPDLTRRHTSYQTMIIGSSIKACVWCCVCLKLFPSRGNEPRWGGKRRRRKTEKKKEKRKEKKKKEERGKGGKGKFITWSFSWMFKPFFG